MMRSMFFCMLGFLTLQLTAQTTGVGGLRINGTTVSDMELAPAPWKAAGRTYGFLYTWDTPYVPKRVLGCSVLAATLWFDNETGRTLKRFDLELGTGPDKDHVRRCLQNDFGRGIRTADRWVWNLGSNRLEWMPEARVLSFRQRAFRPAGKPGTPDRTCEVRFN